MLEVLRSGRLSLGPMGERFEREFAAWLGVEDAVAVSSGTTALHLGVRALGWGAGDEVLTSPFSFVASANCLLYEGARPVFCDVDPETLNLDPAAARPRRSASAAPGILPVHIFGYPAAMPELEALAAKHGLGLLEDACEALGAVDSEGREVGTRGNLATFAFYANKQMTTGEGGMIVPTDPAVAARLRSRAQPGPRRGHGLARPRPARLQLPPLRPRRGARRRPAREARRDARRARRGGGALRRQAWPRSRASADADRRSRHGAAQLVRLPGAAAPRPSTATRSVARLAERGVASKAYLPCIHLFPHLRELGYREGQFPVAEAASARSLALPFFPAMTRVAGRAGVRGSRRIPPLMSRFRKDPDPRFWRINRSLEFDWRLAPYDIDQSQAHARGLREIGVLDDGRAGADRRRPRAGAGADRRARLRVRRGRRGHPHGDRAPARRGDRPAGRQAAHRPLAQRPGRHRRGDGRPGALAAGDRARRRGDGAAAGAGRAPPRLADARLHPPAARPAGLPRPPPARLLLDARPRRAALPVRPRQRLA